MVLQKGVVVNKPGEQEKEAPLHSIIENDRIAVVEALQRAGAGHNLSYTLCTLLRHSCHIVADVKEVDAPGFTVKLWAAVVGQPGVIDGLGEGEPASKRGVLALTLSPCIKGVTPLHSLIFPDSPPPCVQGFGKGSLQGCDVPSDRVEKMPRVSFFVHVLRFVSGMGMVQQYKKLVITWSRRALVLGTIFMFVCRFGRAPRNLHSKILCCFGRFGAATLAIRLSAEAAGHVWR